jgi:3-phosphoshikimate 1-carboxyvinyltransferase
MSGSHETAAIEITPVAGPVNGSIRPPGSKSITNRALICAALAEGASTLSGALDSEDTQVMIAALKQLGIAVDVSDLGRTLRVSGCGGKIPASAAELFVANSGTSMRFLTAMATIGQGVYKLDGIARMRERPIGDLVDSLRQLGVQIDAVGANNCPPVVVSAAGLPGGSASIRGDVSSQFLSGLLMAAPYAQQPITLNVAGTLVSIPYVDMTIKVMESFGAKATATSDYSQIVVSNAKRYRGRDYAIEPDASAASYFWAAAAVTRGSVLVEGLRFDALQGDVEFCRRLEAMGCRVEETAEGIRVAGADRLRGIETDMNAISDTVQTLAVVSLFAEGPTEIRGVEHIRHKETDRIGDLARELRKFGAKVVEFQDGLRIEPGPLHAAAVDTYNDHRMAMSFAVAGLRIPGVVLRNPACVTKTYPRFFEDLARIATPVS